jgi:hypothetical protein
VPVPPNRSPDRRRHRRRKWLLDALANECRRAPGLPIPPDHHSQRCRALHRPGRARVVGGPRESVAGDVSAASRAQSECRCRTAQRSDIAADERIVLGIRRGPPPAQRRRARECDGDSSITSPAIWDTPRGRASSTLVNHGVAFSVERRLAGSVTRVRAGVDERNRKADCDKQYHQDHEPPATNPGETLTHAATLDAALRISGAGCPSRVAGGLSNVGSALSRGVSM